MVRFLIINWEEAIETIVSMVLLAFFFLTTVPIFAVYESITRSGLSARSYRSGGSVGTSDLSKHCFTNELEASALR